MVFWGVLPLGCSLSQSAFPTDRLLPLIKRPYKCSYSREFSLRLTGGLCHPVQKSERSPRTHSSFPPLLGPRPLPRLPKENFPPAPLLNMVGSTPSLRSNAEETGASSLVVFE